MPINNDRHSLREVQRYYCKDCKKTFSKRRDRKKKYTLNFKIELTRMHIEERMSYRVISKRIDERFGKKITPQYICKMVNEVAENTKGSIQLKEEYSPKWEGYLTVDDKYINVKGKKELSLIAVDSSGDIIHSELIKEANQTSYNEFMLFIRDKLNYPVKSVTTDLDEMLSTSIEQVFGAETRHQQCIKHAIEAVKRLIEYQSLKIKTVRLGYRIKQMELELISKKQAYITSKLEIERLKSEYEKLLKVFEEREKLIKSITRMFYCTNSAESEKYLGEIKKVNKEYPIVIRFLEKHKEKLLMHQNDQRITKNK